ALIGYKQLVHNGVPPVKEAEARGLLEVINWRNTMPWTQVVFEKDNLTVALDTKREAVDFTEYGRVIAEGRRLLCYQPHDEVVFVGGMEIEWLIVLRGSLLTWHNPLWGVPLRTG
ncbi:hypothetical protein LINPERPRIM_LOCUS21877, partial [Linum perenne]